MPLEKKTGDGVLSPVFSGSESVLSVQRSANRRAFHTALTHRMEPDEGALISPVSALLPKYDLTGLRIHAVDNCQGFHPDALAANQSPSVLEPLLNRDPDALHRRAG